jgi:hypothetical protein
MNARYAERRTLTAIPFAITPAAWRYRKLIEIKIRHRQESHRSVDGSIYLPLPKNRPASAGLGCR